MGACLCGTMPVLSNWTLVMAWKGWIVLVVGLLAGCASTRVDTWQSADFEHARQAWQFYAWGAPALVDAATYSAEIRLFDSAIRDHADRKLASLGYIEDSSRAQFELDYRIGADTVVSLPGPLSPRDIPERMAAGPNAEYEVSSAFYTHRVLAYHEVSRLKLTFYDVPSRRIVWQATASKLVDNPQASDARVRQIIGDATDKFLQKLPQAAGHGAAE